MRVSAQHIYFIIFGSLIVLAASFFIDLRIHIQEQEIPDSICDAEINMAAAIAVIDLKNPLTLKLDGVMYKEAVLAANNYESGAAERSYQEIGGDDPIKEILIIGLIVAMMMNLASWYFFYRLTIRRWQEINSGAKINSPVTDEGLERSVHQKIDDLVTDHNQMIERLELIAAQMKTATVKLEMDKSIDHADDIAPDKQKGFLERAFEEIISTELPKGLNKDTLQQVLNSLDIDRFPITAEEIAEGVNLTRVTVRRYFEYLEIKGLIISRLKYGTVGRPVKLYDINPYYSTKID